MKKTLIALATLGALSNVAVAQSNVTVYGILDEAARFSTNVNNKDGNNFQLVDGLESGTRLGFKGSEDLGGGTKAIFNLEAGFSLSSGKSLQDGRLFGRTAAVGLSNATYGTLTVGRQNSLGYDFDVATDVYGYGSSVLSGYKGNLTGLRFDNQVKYTNSRGPFSIAVAHAFGNQNGEQSKNSSSGALLGYTNGGLDLRAVYQYTNDTRDGTPGTLVGQNQRLAAVGGSYKIAKATKVFGQYYHSEFDVTDQKNQIYVVGASHEINSKLTAKASYNHDKQSNLNEGHRNTVSGVLSYAFSPRTDVYTEVDYQKLSGGYSNAAYTLNTAANTNTSSAGVSLGLRHKF